MVEAAFLQQCSDDNTCCWTWKGCTQGRSSQHCPSQMKNTATRQGTRHWERKQHIFSYLLGQGSLLRKNCKASEVKGSLTLYCDVLGSQRREISELWVILLILTTWYCPKVQCKIVPKADCLMPPAACLPYTERAYLSETEMCRTIMIELKPQPEPWNTSSEQHSLLGPGLEWHASPALKFDSSSAEQAEAHIKAQVFEQACFELLYFCYAPS